MEFSFVIFRVRDHKGTVLESFWYDNLGPQKVQISKTREGEEERQRRSGRERERERG